MSRLCAEATGQVEVRTLTLADIPAAMRLKELARWNQTERDWLRLLALGPEGCFAATVGGRLVATATTTVYGAELAWIGMVLVDPDYRRRGIATLLMRRALEHLRKRGVRAVKLDATTAGRPVYEALGFVTEGLIERWHGVARPAGAQGCAALDERARRQLFALDRAAFGADRARLLDSLLADACAAPLAAFAPDGRPRGYALARAGAAAAYAGPLVAADEEAAAVLLDGVLNQLAGRPVYVDINTSFPGSERLLAERGFSKQRDLIRMRTGRASGAGTSSLICAIAGPELG
jgi:GNAT superfamily N-acetyltransferase